MDIKATLGVSPSTTKIGKEFAENTKNVDLTTKKEALAYEREYIAKTSKDTNMGFDTFVDIYMSDIKPQIKLSTYVTKEISLMLIFARILRIKAFQR